VSLASHLMERYQLKLKSLTLIPSYGGIFAVSIDGEQVYSNRKTGRFPKNDEIDAFVDERLSAAR
jgi:selenoprotein W-related protein